MSRFILLLCITLLSGSVIAQKQTKLDNALRHLEKNLEEYQLEEADVIEMSVNSSFKSKNSNLTHIFFNQNIQGHDVHNALMSVHVKENGSIFHVRNQFIPAARQKILGSSQKLQAEDAVKRVAQHVGIVGPLNLEIKNRTSSSDILFDKGKISRDDIRSKMVWQYVESAGGLRLAWDVAMDAVNGHDYWNIRVDAATGEILDETSWTNHCHVDKDTRGKSQAALELDVLKDKQIFYTNKYNSVKVQSALMTANMTAGSSASYNVFPWPSDSPIDGPQTLVVDPHHPEYSPFGWHDLDGMDGNETTITEGNNVRAFIDWDRNGQPDVPQPNGGNDLIFDFPYDSEIEPQEMPDASVTNLFYVCNMMHDFAYEYGLTPAAGSFQNNNYGASGNGDDRVVAYSQFGNGEVIVDQQGNSQSFLNNASFGTPPDGGNGTMTMFLWDRSSIPTNYLRVNEPADVAGRYRTALASGGWAAEITDVPVSGKVVIVDDGFSNPTSLGCFTPYANSAEISGNIALVDRDECDFSQKVFYSQQAGAIGVIICNRDRPMVGGMSASQFVGQINIPVVLIEKDDCTRMRVNAGLDGSLNISLVAEDDAEGPDFHAGSYDNGIVAHEYAHGISNRLTAGPTNTGCLGVQEQMGEGWSDYFQLATTAKEGDSGATDRFIGTYATRTTSGLTTDRIFAYTTNMSSNPTTYDDIFTAWDLDLGRARQHRVGFFWCTMLWDVYWALVEEHGFDSDLFNGTGGNNMAIRLVMEGMSLQGCNPGFIRGRDAILLADEAMYDGANQCIIWEAFARRGLGFSADGGNENSIKDGREAFDMPPFCSRQLDVAKQVTPLINAEDVIDVSLVVSNYKPEMATNIVVQDNIPSGTTPANISNGGSVDGDKIIWNLGDLATGEQLVLTYELETPAYPYSETIWKDGFEDYNAIFDEWDIVDVIDNENIWFPLDLDAYEGEYSWEVPNPDTQSEQILFQRNPVEIVGDKPIFRFWHKYQTEHTFDGGIVEVSTDGDTWDKVETLLFRNPYNGSFRGNVFGLPREVDGFWGDSQGWVQSYVDLSSYKGQNLQVRFRFAADDNTSEGFGWSIDNVEYMDMFNYDTEVCVSSDQGDNNCFFAPERGTIVNPGGFVDVEEVTPELAEISIFPNPVSSEINISFELEKSTDVQISIIDASGRIIENNITNTPSGIHSQALDVSRLNSGFYLVKIRDLNGNFESVKKFVVK